MTAHAVIGGAVATCICAFATGSMVWRMAGFARWTPLTGPIGLAAVEVLCLVGVHLPGRRVTAALLVLAATLGGFVVMARRCRRRDLVTTLSAVGLAGVAACLPFIAWGRVGILGLTDDADLSGHLLLADSIGTGHPPVGLDAGWYAGYPTGPHSLVATLHAGLGVPIDAGFNSLLIATLAMSACVALSLLRDAPPAVAVPGAVLAGIPYLAAFYTVQSSFKETLFGVVIVSWTVLLRPVGKAIVGGRPRAILVLGVLTAAAYATYNFPAAAWLAVVAIAAACAWFIHGRRVPRIRLSKQTAVALLVFAGVVTAIAIPMATETKAIVGGVKLVVGGNTKGGNITAQLAAYQMFGLWPSPDARSFGLTLTLTRVLGVAGAAAALWAAWWWWFRRPRPELPAAAFATALIYAAMRPQATAYFTAKALVLASFCAGLMTITAVVLALCDSWTTGLRRRGRSLLWIGLGVAFLAVAGWSSGLVLRGGRVEPPGHRRELNSLRPLLERGPTLYMGQNDYISWLLKGVQVSFPYSYLTPSQLPFATRPEKLWLIWDLFDFDNVPADQLDQFRFVLASRSPYASSPPPNWHLVRRTPSYAVWERRGPTAARSILGENGAPGARLECSASSPRTGVAAVRPAPVVLPSAALRDRTGHVPAGGEFHFANIAAGGTAVARVRLAPGRWTASLQYVSPVPIDIDLGSSHVGAPASQEGPGVFWRFGNVTSRGGRVTVLIHARPAPALATFRTVLVGSLAFTRAGEHDRVIPFRSACGRYVDWFRAA